MGVTRCGRSETAHIDSGGSRPTVGFSEGISQEPNPMWNRREEESVRPPSAAAQPALASGAIPGAEPLPILGRLRGKVDLPRHDVTVGESGKVDADIHAKVVSVAGEV